MRRRGRTMMQTPQPKECDVAACIHVSRIVAALWFDIRAPTSPWLPCVDSSQHKLKRPVNVKPHTKSSPCSTHCQSSCKSVQARVQLGHGCKHTQSPQDLPLMLEYLKMGCLSSYVTLRATDPDIARIYTRSASPATTLVCMRDS